LDASSLGPAGVGRSGFLAYKGNRTVNQQDDAFMKVIIGVLAGLAVFTVVIIILANSIGDLEQETVDPGKRGPQAVADRIAPVGQVRVAGQEPEQAEAAAPEEPARSGEQVYNAACAACHGTGAAGAPKLGDEAAWAPRLEKGFDTLLSHSINGFKGMPARGGNPNLTDLEMHKSVAYMVEQAGGEAPPPPEAGGAAAPEEAAADESAEAEAEPAAQDAQAEAAAAEGDAAQEPAKAEAAADAKDAGMVAGGIDPWLEQADLQQGQQVYQSACLACHATGAAGAPKLGDNAAWAPRIEKGPEILVDHALNGFNAMPAKGGRMDLSDTAVENASAYMVSKSR
jgi:cytochrome c5